MRVHVVKMMMSCIDGGERVTKSSNQEYSLVPSLGNPLSMNEEHLETDGQTDSREYATVDYLQPPEVNQKSIH